jgi:hypothetical protein
MHFRRLYFVVVTATFMSSVCVAPSAHAWDPGCDASIYTGAVLYEPSGDRRTKLFSYRITRTPSGTSRADYIDPDGAVVATEEMRVIDGVPVHYLFENYLEHERGAAEIHDGTVDFTYSSADGPEARSEKVPADYVVGPYVGTYLQKHLDELELGKPVSVHIGILTRLETIRFEFTKNGEVDAGDAGLMGVIGKPANFLFAALADPHLLTYDLKRRRIISVMGRTQLEVPESPGSDHFAGLDAEIVFSYPASGCGRDS